MNALAGKMAITDPIEVFRPGALDGAIVASRRLPYIYVQNWKCGCSTIKSTLWAAEHAVGTAGPPGHPHQRIGGYPFINDPQRWENVGREFTFTFVRNPFVRVLSAYLNKIVQHRDLSVWGRLAARHGLGDGPLGFGDFLRLIAKTPPAQMDIHWRPQRHTVAPRAVSYDFLGSMERFEEDLLQVLGRIFERDLPVIEHVPHRTGSAGLLAHHYGPDELAIVRELYAADFSELGYSTDPVHLERETSGRDRPASSYMRAWGIGCRQYQQGEFAPAAAALEQARRALTGPVFDDKLLRCHCELLVRADAAETIESARHVAAALVLGHGSAETWKWFGKAMLARGRREEGFAALTQSVTMRAPSGRNRRRLRQLQRQLAVIRARQGRRAEALATLTAPSLYRSVAGFPGLRTSAADLGRKGMIYLVAAFAAATGAKAERVDVRPR